MSIPSIRSLTEARRSAEARARQFRAMLGFVMAVEGLFGLWLVAAGVFDFGLTEIEHAGISPGLTGAFLLWAVMFQVPGYFDPVRNRLAVVIGVVGRYAVGAACVLLGLWLSALVILGFGIALNVVYHRVVRVTVMARP